ncbi:MAG: hypothetical protein KJ072_25075 [Verrucomicrobia bacterium]|nr:hypothetical protein [Verrucomicrobiota bacterium]
MPKTIAWLVCLTAVTHAASTVKVEHLPADEASSAFQFSLVPRPVRNDAARDARFSIVSGQRDTNGGSLAALNDGLLPTEEDEPGANFFFRAGSEGGRLLLDLGAPIDLMQVNSYSWHPGGRGPQVYTLFGSDGRAPDFDPEPAGDTDPLSRGWSLLARVDTRPASGEAGGQYGVSISFPTDTLAAGRYLLFDIGRTSAADPFGHTFFSEIDVIPRNGPSLEVIASSEPGRGRESVSIQDGKYTAVIDTSGTPDLTGWTQAEIIPMIREWYPKLVEMLPSEGFEAPVRFSIVFDPGMRGVAATSGTRIRCAAGWIRSNVQGEAKGAIFHEMVHVVQQYGHARRAKPNASRAPGWLVEGITDYLRWYRFEPESGGAEISPRNLARARYDGSYRVTANFLNWVCQQHGEEFIPRLNAAIREGRYTENLWTELTGRAVEELGAAWKAELERRAESPPPAAER